jgi:hypothetical protein
METMSLKFLIYAAGREASACQVKGGDVLPLPSEILRARDES